VVPAKPKPLRPNHGEAIESDRQAASLLARHQRQSDLLDGALETFPASDPVSIIHLNDVARPALQYVRRRLTWP
jgi:hypothetical protein